MIIGAAKMDAWISSGFAAEAHGGESYRQFQSRILSWLKNELPVAEDKVVVTHAGVIRAPRRMRTETTMPFLPDTPLQTVRDTAVGRSWRPGNTAAALLPRSWDRFSVSSRQASAMSSRETKEDPEWLRHRQERNRTCPPDREERIVFKGARDHVRMLIPETMWKNSRLYMRSSPCTKPPSEILGGMGVVLDFQGERSGRRGFPASVFPSGVPGCVCWVLDHLRP